MAKRTKKSQSQQVEEIKEAATRAQVRSAKAPRAQTVKAKPKVTSDDQDRAMFLSHLKEVTLLENALQEAKDALSLQYKKAKGEGFPKSDFKDAFKMRELDGERNKKAEITRSLRVARWLAMDLGAQLDLFLQDERVPAADRSYEEGKSRAMLGNSLKCDYAPETEQYRRFAQGWHDGQAILAQGFEKLEEPETASKDDNYGTGLSGTPPKPSNVVSMTRSELEQQREAEAHKFN